MPALSISGAWEDTKAIVVREGRLLASVSLALIVLPQSILWVIGLPVGPQATLLSKIFYGVVILLGFAAQIALNRLAIGPSVTVGEAVTRGFARLPALFAALVILVVALVVLLMVVALGLGVAGVVVAPGAGEQPPPMIVLLLLVLAVLTLAVCQLFIPVAAEESAGPIRMFSRSWQLARSEYLRLLAFVIVVFLGITVATVAGEYVVGSALVVFVGPPGPATVSALVLGVVVGTIQAAFTVLGAVMLARIYLQLAGRPEAEAGVPSKGI